MNTPRNILLLALALGLVLQAESVLGSAFKVTPVQVFLDPGKRSELLTLSNESDRALRFQITAKSWAQSLEGDLELGETEDVVFFPTLLTLGPGEERNVRVGLTTEIGEVEKTYRIFFEELPGLEPEQGGATVQVLTKMGIPIFAAPRGAAAKPMIAEAGLNGGVVRFQVVNGGNAHTMVRTVRVMALDAAGKVLVDRQREGWYVLPGTPRRFEVPIEGEACAGASRIVIRVWTNAGGDPGGLTLESEVAPTAEACRAE